MFRKGHPVFCCIKNQKSYYFKPTVSEFTTVSYIQ